MSWVVRLHGEVRDRQLQEWDEPWWLMGWQDAVCARSVDAAHARVFDTQWEAVSAIADSPWVGEVVEV